MKRSLAGSRGRCHSAWRGGLGRKRADRWTHGGWNLTVAGSSQRLEDSARKFVDKAIVSGRLKSAASHGVLIGKFQHKTRYGHTTLPTHIARRKSWAGRHWCNHRCLAITHGAIQQNRHDCELLACHPSLSFWLLQILGSKTMSDCLQWYPFCVFV